MEWNQRYMAVIQPEGIGVIISEDEFSTFRRIWKYRNL